MDINVRREYGQLADYRQMRWRLFAVAIVGALVVIVGMQLASHLLSRTLLEDGYARLQQQLSQTHKQHVHNSLEHHAGHLQLLLHNPALLKAVREQDREALMREVYWQYQLKRQENPHIEVMHFHDPNNITLLRLHQPESYGDDLSELRPMIADGNHLRARRDGFEIGKNGVSYRVAIPIEDDDEHLGMVEIGVNIAHFTRRLRESHGVEVGLFFHREAMGTYLAEHGESQLVGVGEQRLAFPPMSDALLVAGGELQAGQEGYLPFYHQGRRYVSYPLYHLKNYQGEEVATLLAVADVSQQIGKIWRFTLWSSVVWLLLLTLLIAGQYRIFSRMQHCIDSLAFYDPLTGLPNRRLLMEKLQQSMLNCRRSRQHMALLFIDLDNFKTLNDTHGHQYGDEMLKGVAQRLREAVRLNDTVARQGGDEFVVVLEGVGEEYDLAQQTALAVADKLVEVLAPPHQLSDGLSWQCSGSIGVALCDEMGMELEELMRRADVAMYRAKAAGRNQVASY